MNATQLAEKMLEWEKRRVELDALTAEIEAAVLEIGKTQVVGRCRASYSGGRSTYDYALPGASVDQGVKSLYATERRETDWDAVADAVPEVVERFTTIVIDYDWRAICKAAGVEPIVVSKTAPSVTVKLEA